MLTFGAGQIKEGKDRSYHVQKSGYALDMECPSVWLKLKDAKRLGPEDKVKMFLENHLVQVVNREEQLRGIENKLTIVGPVRAAQKLLLQVLRFF